MKSSSDNVYIRRELIGKGSFGQVFKGLNKITGETVAIKVLDLESKGEEIDDIQREIFLLQRCDSEYITRYHGSFLQGTKLCVVMDLAKGGSVRDVLQSGVLEEKYIVVIAREVINALCYLHKTGIIHRDIKAANILLTEEGKVKLCDFGVAGQFSMSSLKRHSFVGTPFWMAPEVLRRTEYDYKADVWSFGITIYEIATGGPPQIGCGDPMKGLLMSGIDNIKLQGDFTAAMHEFMCLCLQENPDLRASVEDLSKHKWLKTALKDTQILKDLVKRHEDWQKLQADQMSLRSIRSEEDLDDRISEIWNFDTVKSNSIKPSTPSSSTPSTPSTESIVDAYPPSTRPLTYAASPTHILPSSLPTTNPHTVALAHRKNHRRNQSSVYVGTGGQLIDMTKFQALEHTSPSPPTPAFESVAENSAEPGMKPSSGEVSPINLSGQPNHTPSLSHPPAPSSKRKNFNQIHTKDLNSPHIPRSFSESITSHNPLMYIFTPPVSSSSQKTSSNSVPLSSANTTKTRSSIKKRGPDSAPPSYFSPPLTSSLSMPFIIDTSVLSPHHSPPITSLSGDVGPGNRPRNLSFTNRIRFFSKSRTMDSRLMRSNSFALKKDGSSMINTSSGGVPYPETIGPSTVRESNRIRTELLGNVQQMEEFPPLRPRASTAPEIGDDFQTSSRIRQLSFLLNFTIGSSNTPSDPHRSRERKGTLSSSRGGSSTTSRMSSGFFNMLSNLSSPASPAASTPHFEESSVHSGSVFNVSSSLFSMVRSGSVTNFFQRKNSASQECPASHFSLPISEPELPVIPSDSFVQVVNLPVEARGTGLEETSQILRSMSLASLFELSKVVDLAPTSLTDLSPTKEDDEDLVVMGAGDAIGVSLSEGVRPIFPKLTPVTATYIASPVSPKDVRSFLPSMQNLFVPSLGTIRCPRIIFEPILSPVNGEMNDQILVDLDSQLLDLVDECCKWIDHADESFRHLTSFEQA